MSEFYKKIENLTRDTWNKKQAEKRKILLDKFYKTLNNETFQGFLIQIQNKMIDAALVPVKNEKGEVESQTVIKFFEFYKENKMYEHLKEFDSLFQEELKEEKNSLYNLFIFFSLPYSSEDPDSLICEDPDFINDLRRSSFYMRKWIYMLLGLDHNYCKEPPLGGFRTLFGRLDQEDIRSDAVIFHCYASPPANGEE